MVKLVFVYNWGDEGCSGQAVIPFEYSSKDDAILNILDRPINEFGCITMFDISIPVNEIDYIIGFIYDLDEWFEIKKNNIL